MLKQEEITKVWIFALIVICGTTDSMATKCDSVDGYWYNQLGSEMLLEEGDGMLIGEYRTAVEREPGAAGKTYSPLRGVEESWESENLLGFTVIFNEGRSQTTWLGQCTKCDGQEVLRTTWILRVRMNTPSDEWKSTMINEDIFIREDNLEGPRRHLGTNTPRRPHVVRSPAVPELNDTSNNHNIQGKWYSKDGASLELMYTEQGIINGTYIGLDSTSTRISGFFQPKRPDSTFGLYAIMPEPSIAFVGVGQYHHAYEKEMLETSWLQREHGGLNRTELFPVGFIRRTFVRHSPEVVTDPVAEME